MEHYGNKIRLLRKKAKLSQEDMAKITGIPQTSISRFEKSEYCDLEYIIKAYNHILPNFTIDKFFIEHANILDEYFKQGIMNNFLDTLKGFPEEKRIKIIEHFAGFLSVLK